MARRRWALLVTALALGSGGAQAQAPWRSITIDERLAARASLAVGDTAVLAPAAGAAGDTVLIAGITRRSADPSEIARSEYRVRLHLDHLQSLTGAGDRVGRFAVATVDRPAAVDSAAARIRKQVINEQPRRKPAGNRNNQHPYDTGWPAQCDCALDQV